MPITLSVEAAADLQSFERVADRAEERFAKAGQKAGSEFSSALNVAVAKSDPDAVRNWERAYDRLRDSMGKVRLEQERLSEAQDRGAARSQMIARSEALERAKRAEARAVREARDAYDELGESGSKALGVLADLSAGTRLGGLIGDVDVLAAKFGTVGLATGVALTGVAGLAIGVAGATKALYDLGGAWDSIADGITLRTGKMGADLDAITEQVERVVRAGSSVPLAQLGDIAGQVSASLNLTGEQLGTMTDYLGDLGKATGEVVNVKQLAMVFDSFGISTNQQIPVLNALAQASREMQVPFGELVGTMVDAGPVASELGLSWEELVGILASFDDAGVPAEKSLKGLKELLKTSAELGKEPKIVLQEAIDKIREFKREGNDPAAQTLAQEVFGGKNFDSFLAAIEKGKLGSQQFSTEVGKNIEDVRDLIDATSDWEEELQNLKSTLATDLGPTADFVFGAINSQLKVFSGSIKWTTDLVTGNLRPDPVVTPPVDPSVWTPLIAGAALGQPVDQVPVGAPASPFGSIPIPGATGSMPIPSATTTAPSPFGSIPIPGVTVIPSGDDADLGPILRGTPGRGFPMPWRAPAGFGQPDMGSGGDIAIPSDLHGSHQQIGVLAQMAAGMGLEFTSGAHGRPQDGGYHPSGQAGDFGNQRQYGPNTPEMNQFASAMLQFAPFLSELIYSGAPYNVHNGKLVPTIDQPGSPYSTGQAGYHGDHVHIAVRDEMAAAFAQAVRGGVPMPTGLGAPSVPLVGMPAYTSSDLGATAYGSREERDARERVQDVLDSIAQMDARIVDIKSQMMEADQAILDAEQARAAAAQKAAAAEVGGIGPDGKIIRQADKDSADKALTAATQAKARAVEARAKLENDTLKDAQTQRDRMVSRSLRDARESLDEVLLGTQHGQPSSGGGGRAGRFPQIGAPIAGDFGLSGGLAGLAGNLTNFIGNIAAAPLLGSLGALAVGLDPTGAGAGGGGLIGMAAAGLMGGGSGAAGGGQSPFAPFGALGAPPGPAPTTVGGSAPTAVGGGGFSGLGGLPMAAIQGGISAGGLALDGLAPGAGTVASMAANTTIQLINRGIEQAGKSVAIGLGGIQEAFSLSDPAQGWFGRIAGAFAGATPAIPNVAGAPANPAPGQGTGPPPGPTGPNITLNYQANNQTEDRSGADITRHLQNAYSTPGR